MKPDFKRIKNQIRVDDSVVNETINKIKDSKNAKYNYHFRKISALAASICLVLVFCVTLPSVMNIQQSGSTHSNPSDDELSNNSPVNDPIQGAQSYNDGVTISEALAKMMTSSTKDATFDIKLKAIDMVDVYASTYANRLYDEKTYDEWWDEYEIYTNRMLEIEAQLKDAPNETLEAEYNNNAEKAEKLAAYMSKIQREQKAESVAAEIKWLKSLGIEAEYKGGYFYFSASADDIKNLSKGKCDYFIDTINESKSPVEEVH